MRKLRHHRAVRRTEYVARGDPPRYTTCVEGRIESRILELKAEVLRLRAQVAQLRSKLQETKE